MTIKTLRGRCFRASPVFSRDIKEIAHRYSDSRQRFDPSLIAGGVRCRFGHVQVLVCRPFSRKLRPFPTTFWLVCPFLVRRAGMIESLGGVNELEEFIRSRSLVHEWRGYNRLHQVVRLGLMGERERKCVRMRSVKVFRSVMRSGVGGMRQTESVSVKCLHLQTASLIALGHHTGGEWLKAKGLCGDCGEAMCVKSRSCSRFCSP